MLLKLIYTLVHVVLVALVSAYLVQLIAGWFIQPIEFRAALGISIIAGLLLYRPSLSNKSLTWAEIGQLATDRLFAFTLILSIAFLLNSTVP